MSLRNIKLLIEYDGTNYAGWQRQAAGRTIQEEIEKVLSQILQESITIAGAGRTDAGVHARAQVANFRTESKLPPREIMGGLNGLLPEDIVVHGVEDMPPDFHARFSAKERTYSYTITRTPTALMRNYSWTVPYLLDLGLMNQAADAITGSRDFRSFCKSDSEVPNTACDVRNVCWKEDGSLLAMTISADRFLHGMVRALVGTMVDVGRGYSTLDEFYRILERHDRSEAGMAAPAKGLVLERVLY